MLHVLLPMLRWSLLLLALALLPLALLTVVKSPDWSEWKLALLAGEYGHWLALVPVLLGALAWWTRGASAGVAVATALLCALAVGLFLRPCLEAWKLGGALPGQLARQFGPVALARPPFSFSALFGAAPAPVPAETSVFSGDLSLDFYRAVGQTRAPCVLLIHGGGWDGGSRTEIVHFTHWLAHQGYAVAALDYRLAPHAVWPAQRDDTVAALAYLKTHSARLGLDPTRFVLLGRSAGGNIAEAVAYTAGDPAIRGVIALYAPADPARPRPARHPRVAPPERTPRHPPRRASRAARLRIAPVGDARVRVQPRRARRPTRHVFDRVVLGRRDEINARPRPAWTARGFFHGRMF